ADAAGQVNNAGVGVVLRVHRIVQLHLIEGAICDLLDVRFTVARADAYGTDEPGYNENRTAHVTPPAPMESKNDARAEPGAGSAIRERHYRDWGRRCPSALLCPFVPHFSAEEDRASPPRPSIDARQIGRASCRERV